MEHVKTVLVLAPHPDDAEFGCGGTINRLCKEGKAVHVATFSPCVKSIPKGFPKDVLSTELSESMTILGVDQDKVYCYDFPVRDFPAHRQEILENLVSLRSKVSPDLVFVPASFDFHQDHQVISQEGLRAFKNVKILGYELPWNNIRSNINFHVKLTEEDVSQKEKSVAAYKSQGFRPYKKEGFFRSLAVLRGMQTDAEFAEGFELIKWNI